MIRTVTVNEAVNMLRDNGLKIDPETLMLGLRQKVYPFGVAIERKQWVYQIFARQLKEWIKERSEYESV